MSAVPRQYNVDSPEELGRRIRAAQDERRAKHRLVPFTERPHCAQHGFIPNQWTVAVAIARGHRMAVDKIIPKEDRAHVHHVFGVLGACGHAHEHLVRMRH